MGRGLRAPVRFTAVVLAVAVLTIQCGDLPDEGDVAGNPEPATSLDRATMRGPKQKPTTTRPRPDLVINRRAMTTAELERIEDDGESGALDCVDYGGIFWDYGPLEDDARVGREPEDALRDAISDLTEDAGIVLPQSGWTELVEHKGRSTFLHEESNWQALIVVQGDDGAGIWRHTAATVCSG